jgi:membrane protein implicated in regulation of membrane protease activity
MSEFIDAILSPVNLVLSLLLLACLVYWVMVFLGALDIDLFDADVDVDADADLDLDAADHGLSTISLMRFFNLGQVPLTVLASLFVLILWVIGVGTHRYVGDWSILLQLLALVPMFVVAALLTKVVSTPLKKLFRELERAESSGEIDFIGKRCTVSSWTIDQNHGQVEVVTTGSPIKLNALLEGADHPLQKGAEVVIVSQDPDSGVYRVRGF